MIKIRADKNNVLALAEVFMLDKASYRIFPVPGGHINDTYYLKPEKNGNPAYVLQKINHHIFRDIDKLMKNIERITLHLKNQTLKHFPTMSYLELIPTKNGDSYFSGVDGAHWRCYNFIPHRSFEKNQISNEIAFEGGCALGRFQRMLSDMPEKNLHETIPHFHNLRTRYHRFENALKNAQPGRLAEAAREIEFFEKKINSMADFDKVQALPLRITHNDTKFNNILFDEEGKALCLIDLDTVMNGYVIYDFGDAVRTLANTSQEDENDPGRVHFSFSLFAAFAEGYLQSASQMLLPAEKQLLAFSTKLMTFIIGLRFLTDYLEGDIYYKTDYPGHNLVRSLNQIVYFKKLEDNFDRMQAFINDAGAG
jgi:Ser/Thr protein kinase RdoA (MazF antagonist)